MAPLSKLDIISLPGKLWKRDLEFWSSIDNRTKALKKDKKQYILKRTRISPIGRRKKERLKKEGSEVHVFREIWESRIHSCQICQKPVINAFVDNKLKKPQCFPHILSKWMYPEYRTLKENIWLVCDFDCHNELDRVCNDLIFRRQFENQLKANLILSKKI